MAKKPRISKEAKIASFASLLKESDRGCVLLVGSLFDTRLEQIHEAAIALNLTGSNSPKNFFHQKLLGQNGPLSNFHGKINLAYAFGLITVELHDALHVIRDLRNEAAHSAFDFSLRNAGIVSHLKKLKKYNDKIDEDRVMKFEMVLQEVDDTVKFHFIVCCHVIFEELDDLWFAQLKKLLEKREAKAVRPTEPE